MFNSWGGGCGVAAGPGHNNGKQIGGLLRNSWVTAARQVLTNTSLAPRNKGHGSPTWQPDNIPASHQQHQPASSSADKGGNQTKRKNLTVCPPMRGTYPFFHKFLSSNYYNAAHVCYYWPLPPPHDAMPYPFMWSADSLPITTHHVSTQHCPTLNTADRAGSVRGFSTEFNNSFRHVKMSSPG